MFTFSPTDVALLLFCTVGWCACALRSFHAFARPRVRVLNADCILRTRFPLFFLSVRDWKVGQRAIINSKVSKYNEISISSRNSMFFVITSHLEVIFLLTSKLRHRFSTMKINCHFSENTVIFTIFLWSFRKFTIVNVNSSVLFSCD